MNVHGHKTITFLFINSILSSLLWKKTYFDVTIISDTDNRPIWWHVPLILEFRLLRQEHNEFEEA